jgi:hypothetical protein
MEYNQSSPYLLEPHTQCQTRIFKELSISTQTRYYLPPFPMPTNASSVRFTPDLKVGFFGPNRSFHHGIIAGVATLPQVSRILYVNFIFGL